MKKILTGCLLAFAALSAQAADRYDNADTLVVARDGTGEFRTVTEAIEVCRAFMDYHKVIYVKSGVYKEKIVIPSWISHIEICGQDNRTTVITYDDHANIRLADTAKPMGTFRTYTLKVEGSDITFKNIAIENNAARLGQAVALHTEGDRLIFINCRFLGNQDTVYTGTGGTRLYFYQCYIEGTTDFIFGPATAWFEQCTICSKANSYITAASTPAQQPFGYVFNRCHLVATPDADKVFLGRPWRPYAATLFMNCRLDGHILPAGWDNWRNAANERTARYAEYDNTGAGAHTARRVAWARQLSKREAAAITLQRVFNQTTQWLPSLPTS